MESRIIPVVIGTLGAVSRKFRGFIKQLEICTFHRSLLSLERYLSCAKFFNSQVLGAPELFY